jgi:hypothetical protein
MLFMARTGNQIIDIQSFEINNKGDIEYKSPQKMTSGSRYGKGVDISFRKINTNEVRHVYYFPVDLSNKGLQNNPNCKLFIEKLDTNITTYIKSASYLMHSNTFSDIRTLILSKSKYLIQDDSGIPYKYLNKNTYDIKLYGNYIKPIQAFNWIKQEDLKQAFKEHSKPLPFNIGYGKISNQFVIRRK